MKIVFISDTHGKHQELTIPNGDMIIHAGDISSIGKEKEIIEFINWYKSLPHKYKIFIAGNHDFFFEIAEQGIIDNKIPNDIIYLNDSGCSIEGINIWGSPIQPEFLNWAFNRKRGEEIKKHWDLIPENIDVLITHGPPYGILDQTQEKEHVGCCDLIEKVLEIKPRIHVFGHIHEDCGIVEKDNITFINASVLNHKYVYTNTPVLLNYNFKNGKHVVDFQEVLIDRIETNPSNATITSIWEEAIEQYKETIQTFEGTENSATCLICNTTYYNGNRIVPYPICSCGNLQFDITQHYVKYAINWPLVGSNSKDNWKEEILSQIKSNGKPNHVENLSGDNNFEFNFEKPLE